MTCMKEMLFVFASIGWRCRLWIHCACRRERRDKRNKSRKNNRGSGLKVFAAAMPDDKNKKSRYKRNQYKRLSFCANN